MENTEYIYKNAFMFMESGELSVDLYRAIKDEISYMVEAKYKVYMDKLCDATDIKDNQFYSDFVEVLHKVEIILMNSKVTNLKKYIGEYFETAKLLQEKPSVMTKTVMTSLGLFDSLINKLVYSIMVKVNNKEIKADKGVYSVLNTYFGDNDYKIYVGMQDFLEECYGTIYDATRINYGGFVYGKKY